MGKALSKRKSKIQYRDICLQIDVVRQATTVRTFDKRTWSNHWDGQFIYLTPNKDGSVSSEIVQISKIYQNIQTVAKKDIVIARKDFPDQALRFLVNPYVIGRRK
jgi:hypothetical protein